MSEGGSAASVLVLPVSMIGVVELSLPAGEAADVLIAGVVEEVSGGALVPKLSGKTAGEALCSEFV